MTDLAQAAAARQGLCIGMAVSAAVALAAIALGLAEGPLPTMAAATAAAPARATAAPLADPGPAQGTSGGAVATAVMSAPDPRTAAAAREADPTVVLAQVVPQPVPLARWQRDPAAGARLDAAAAAAVPPPHGGPQVLAVDGLGLVSLRDEAGRPLQAALANAQIDEAALGLRFLPGSQPLASSGRRVPDGAGGETLTLHLAASGTLEAALAFYRAQLGGATLQRPAEGQVLLQATDARDGNERSVWIVQYDGGLAITLARARPGPAAMRP